MAKHVPTVRSRRLTSELRRLREEAGLTWPVVAEEMGWSESKLYRIENDKSRVLPRDVKRLLDLYEISDETRRAPLIELARRANEKGWWHQYSETIPTWFQPFIGLEASAASIRVYESELVPGLLQTEGYMRAIASTAPVLAAEEEIERSVEVRLARQRRLTEEQEPLELWMVLNEAVIRRVVGGPDIMREQLDHLAAMAQNHRITLQILPFAKGEHSSMLGAFQVLEFAGEEVPPVVYLEHQTGGLYVEKPEDIRRYTLMYNHLSVKALSEEESLAMVRQAADGMS
ncbi:helix-turn-helix domain-containing protein [Halostreptopolyspora alba]|uniref:helix-turn-helix domain-containing protein n=1 Tax=Halostreptopolyspora alba TaxID=2487137 RepID=UPI0026A39958